METVSLRPIPETGVSNSKECQLDFESSDEQMNQPRKKKRKSRNKEKELKGNDSHITNAASFEERKEGETEKTTSEDQVQLPENCFSTLLPATEDSLRDANKNGSSRKRLRSREKKKKKQDDALCEERMLDVAEKTINENQMHPPKNPLSNITKQIDSCQQAQDSCEKPEAAQHCISPVLSTQEDSQSGAINMTCSEIKKQRKKRKKDKERNKLRECGVDTNSEVTTKCDARRVSGERKKKRKSRNKEKELKSNDSHTNKAASFEERMEGETEKTTSKDQVQLPENCLSTLLSTTEDSLPDANRNGSNRKRLRSRKKKQDDALCEEKMLDAAEKTINEDQVHPPKNPLSNTTIQEDSCQQAKDSCEMPEASQHRIDPVSSTQEDSQSGAINMSCSERKRQKKKRKKDKNINALRESGVDNISVVTTKCDARHVSEAKKSKLKSTEEKNVVSVVINGCMKSKGDTVEQQASDITMSQTQNPKAKKKKKRKTKTVDVCDQLGNTSATSMKSGSVECMETAGVSEVRSERRKRKKKKTSSTDQESADMEVCDSSGNTLLATTESGSVECLLDHSNKEVLENCDKNAGQEFVGEDRTRKTEKSATGEICGDLNPGTRKETKDEIGGSKQKRKKKKKSCEDHNTDNMDEKKDDVSVSRTEEKIKTSLSSSVLIQDNVAQGVASQETGDLPRCSCDGQSTRKLVVFDLNGILADIVQGDTGEFVPDGKISSRSVFRRPFVASFLDFCFKKFDVGIWSSRRIGLDYMTNLVMGNHARNLWFCFDQSVCITTNFKTLEKSTKPLFLKDLRRVWSRFGTCLSCGKRKYDETNTLLVDDSPDKALCNPPHTGIFPFPYQYTDREDSALGPDGELRKYMERLVDAENVHKFVEENPIGQTPITETHRSWSFYSRVINAHKDK